MMDNKAVLLLIDIQNMYFVGDGRLRNPEEAAENAAKLLKAFRENNLPIIHIKHRFDTDDESLCDINATVSPLGGETVFEKTRPDSFYKTGLAERLESLGTKKLIVAGMMLYMCVDTTVRAAYNSDYEIILADDACADRSLQYREANVSAEAAHNAFMAALGDGFAELMKTDKIIEKYFK